MNSQDIISSGVLELYVLGIASAEESRDVEAWAKQFPEVADEIRAIEESLENYAVTHAMPPAEKVKEKVFISINAQRNVPVIAISSRWKWVAAASILLLIGSLYINFSYYQKYQDAQSALANTQTELQQQKEFAQTLQGDIEKMGSMNAMPVSLKGMPDVPNSAARVYWMQDSHEVWIDPSYMPKAPEGMEYQLWGFVDGKPVSGGMIKTLNNGSNVRLQKMKSFGKVEAFAVTLEKAGPEKPAPGGKVYVMGKI